LRYIRVALRAAGTGEEKWPYLTQNCEHQRYRKVQRTTQHPRRFQTHHYITSHSCKLADFCRMHCRNRYSSF